MGDFVEKQETQEQLIQKSLQWDNAEKPIEEEENNIAAANGHHIINNFSLRAIESFTGDLDTVLQQWLEWQ